MNIVWDWNLYLTKISTQPSEAPQGWFCRGNVEKIWNTK